MLIEDFISTTGVFLYYIWLNSFLDTGNSLEHLALVLELTFSRHGTSKNRFCIYVPYPSPKHVLLFSPQQVVNLRDKFCCILVLIPANMQFLLYYTCTSPCDHAD